MLTTETSIDEQTARFAERVRARLTEQVESLLYYPHPFTPGGFVVVYKDDAGFLPERVAAIYQCQPPPGMALHHLRRGELFQLALPGLYTLPFVVNEFGHLALSLKHKGVVLHGRDIRAEVPSPADPRLMLDNHIEGCMLHLRAHGLLRWLAGGEYLALLEELDKQFRYLMGTALLVRGCWDVEMGSVPRDFGRHFEGEPVKAVWDEFDALRRGAEDEGDRRAAAFEAVWLFECFLQRLKGYTR